MIVDPDELERRGWKEFVVEHAEGNFFQLPDAYRFFERVVGYSPTVTGVVDAVRGEIMGILVGVLQREVAWYGPLTARSIVWGGPLVEEPEVAKVILSAYERRIAGRAIYTQFRNLFDCEELEPIFAEAKYAYLPHVNFLVPTAERSPAGILKAMSKSRARQIRKGLGEAEIVTEPSEAETEAFLCLLSDLYRAKVRKPLPHKSFFEGFVQYLVPRGLGKLIVIRQQDAVVGGILCPILPGRTIYEWYIAGDDQRFKDAYPSVLATWAAIAEAQRLNLDHFDFLGAGRPDADYGVRDFKARFGGLRIEYGRFEKIHRPLIMRLATVGLRAYQWVKR